MEQEFHLPDWMSADVAHSHETLIRLSQTRCQSSDDGSYFLNSEVTSHNPRSDAPNNRRVDFDLALDDYGNIIEKSEENSKKETSKAFFLKPSKK